MYEIQFLLALLMAFFVGSAAGYIGSLMLTKRMSLMGGALGHLTLPGITLALIYNFDVSIGAFAFLFVGIILIWLFEQKTQLPIEALTAVVFASSTAAAFLFLPQNKTFTALIGNISQISLISTVFAIVLAILIIFITKKIFYNMILISISQDVAIAEKINVKTYKLIYLFSIALTIALGVRIVGGLMTAALVAIPACTSKNLSKSLFQYAYFSMLFGGFSAILGVLLHKITLFPAGPLIILCSSFLFSISIFFKKARI